ELLDTLLAGPRSLGTKVHRCDRNRARRRRGHALEADVVPPDGALRSMSQKQLNGDGGSVLRGLGLQCHAVPLALPRGTIGIIHLTGPPALRLTPVQPRLNLPILAGYSRRAVVYRQPV